MLCCVELWLVLKLKENKTNTKQHIHGSQYTIKKTQHASHPFLPYTVDYLPPGQLHVVLVLCEEKE